MRKRIICGLPILAALLTLSNPQPTFACVCRGAEQPPCDAFQKATAMFSGVVVDITNIPFQQGDVFHEVLIGFKVEGSYKGVSESQVSVATVTGTECDLDFQKGGRYFVYAYNDSKHNRLLTGVCTRTAPLIDAEEDINYARSLDVHNLRTSILGADKGPSPLKGSEILVEGQGTKYRAIAGEYGSFNIELEQAGSYKVTVIGPPGYIFLTLFDTWRASAVDGRPAVEFERKISEGQCDFVDFSQFLTVRKR